LPVFRATAVSWVAAKYPAHETELAVSIRANARAAAFAATANASAAEAASDAAAVASDAVAVAFAASASASAADVSAAAAFTFASASAADVSAADASASALWLEVSADARRVEEEEAAASEIAGWPLWPQGQPDKVHRLWQEMKVALLAARQRRETRTRLCADRGRTMEPRPGNRKRRD